MSEPVAPSGKQGSAEADVENFREQLGPFVVAAETTRMPMIFSDAVQVGDPIIFVNDSFLSLLGYERAEILGHSFYELIAQGTDEDALAEVRAAFEGRSNLDPEIRYHRKDGGYLCASLFVSPVRDHDGVVVQHFASLIDLTAHRAEQEHLKMLIAELNHRVKNTLSAVQSIVAQALRGPSDPKIIAEAIESRLYALSRSHDLLTRQNWHSAGLFDLIRTALEPFATTDEEEQRIAVTGENIQFSPKVVLALSIAIHELAINAVKYGALSNEVGRIGVSWALVGPADSCRLILQWRETGGPVVKAPHRKGFGSRVIEHGLAYELDGHVSLDFQSDGVVCTIELPAPARPSNG